MMPGCGFDITYVQILLAVEKNDLYEWWKEE